MERRAINPWTWQDQFGFSQAVEVSGAQKILFCAGQTSVDKNGNVLHEGDIAGQANLALDNLEEVLKGAGMELGNVVNLRIYTTDVDGLIAGLGAVAPRIFPIKASQTLIGVARLAFPTLLVELEATAVA